MIPVRPRLFGTLIIAPNMVHIIRPNDDAKQFLRKLWLGSRLPQSRVYGTEVLLTDAEVAVEHTLNTQLYNTHIFKLHIEISTRNTF